jgi:hypothetical protein
MVMSAAPRSSFVSLRRAARAVMALALYALIVHVFALDALAVSRAASLSHAATAGICVNGVAGTQGEVPLGSSHADCAFLCQSGGCGRAGPASGSSIVVVQRIAAAVMQDHIVPYGHNATEHRSFTARGPPIIG